MANQKLTDRNLMNEQLHDDDVIHIVDVSDTTDSPEGTSKKWKILKWLENLSNKSNDIATDASSTTKYPSVKAVYDWAVGLFQTIMSKASSAEIDTGTDNDKYVTPDALAGSNAFTKTVQQYCVEWETELAVEDGVGYIIIPAECNGMNLISASARVGTAGVTGNTTFDIYNVTDSTTMLSSAISIASGATSGTGTVDEAHDDVATGDVIRIDIDSIASGTAPKGLIVTLAFRLP